MSKVDVIIPAYNTPLSYLADALASLIAQTMGDWCAWIVDDGSDDSYGVQLKSLLESYNDNRLNYLYTGHKGATGSRNVAMGRGSAIYIALLDSDDVWLPHHLAQQVAVLDTRPDVSLAHSYFTIIDADSQTMPTPAPLVGLNELDLKGAFTRILKQNFGGASTVVLRRSILEATGGFDPSFPSLGDKEWWMRMLNAGAKFWYEPVCSALYRVHPGNVSHKTGLLLDTRRRVIEKAEALVRGNPQFSSIDWPVMRREMARHMYREAAEVYFSLGHFSKAIRYAVPWRAGFSLRTCSLAVRACFAVVVAFLAATVHDVTALIVKLLER
ncbi:MAG: glycosyltransferase family 2 protein [Betaproteobacteria bacterium]|nr:glycosyltransferase family 2 protein [Betaproteobacteria bacterium]